MGLSKATGFPLDTSPTLDRLQTTGIGFERNYCTAPLCVPSRVSMLTGRWPGAHRVRNNLMETAAFFEKDLYQVAHEQGYKTALVGKNYSYLRKGNVDVWRAFDELNKVTLSGNQKMVRMGDWKLVYDMMGYGELYDMKSDPCELKNLFNQPEHGKQQTFLMAELLMWVIRTEDSLPTGPQNKKYVTKWPAKHNWYAPHWEAGPPPVAYIP